jgi:RpiB/LacA/LacB family sugar-phosphate isomerase
MPLAIASDHAGFELKESICQHLRDAGIEFVDLGCHNPDRVDYPDFAMQAARKVAAGECERGILICGSGIGMSIVANKVKGIRAALCCDTYMAKVARQHNDANILALGGRTTCVEKALEIVDLFLNTAFEGGRHQIRVEKINSFTGR